MRLASNARCRKNSTKLNSDGQIFAWIQRQIRGETKPSKHRFKPTEQTRRTLRRVTLRVYKKFKCPTQCKSCQKKYITTFPIHLKTPPLDLFISQFAQFVRQSLFAVSPNPGLLYTLYRTCFSTRFSKSIVSS